MKTALVTGATGFLGGALALRLAADGVDVKALARHPEKGNFLSDHMTIVKGDITDLERMREAVAGCEIVFHVAAALGGSLEHQRRTNVAGTRNVMEAAADAQVKRVVHISTIAVYGYKHAHDVTEETPICPSKDAYSISKAEAEAVVREVGERRRLSYSIIRPGAIFGPRAKTWTGLVFKLARRKPFIFMGNGQGAFPAIFVEDVVDLIMLAATHPAAHGEAFNVVYDPPPTFREYIHAYSRLVGHQSWVGIPILPIKLIVPIIAMLGKPYSPIKDLPDMVNTFRQYFSYKTKKAEHLLGWQPKINVEKGVEKCALWLIENGFLTFSLLNTN